MSLLDAIRARRWRKEKWVDRLPPKLLNELKQVVKVRDSGEKMSAQAIADAMTQQAGFRITRGQIAAWLRGDYG